MNNEKITDKYFRKVMASSIISIVICMMCLASLTWAWFSFDVQSSGNTIRSAEFNATVYVDPSNQNQTTYRNVVFAPGDYHVTVKQTGSARTGYCLVTVDGVTYFAGNLQEKLNADANVTFCSLEFDLKITTASATISIDPVWGIYYGSYDELPSSLNGSTVASTSNVDGETTAIPEETTAVPEETTTATEETTVAPEETTAAPEETTVSLEETTGPAEPLESTDLEETDAETISGPDETAEPTETEATDGVADETSFE